MPFGDVLRILTRELDLGENANHKGKGIYLEKETSFPTVYFLHVYFGGTVI